MFTTIEFNYINVDPVELGNGRFVSVFSGSNNCGKTALLKTLYSNRQTESYFLGANRFYNTEFIPIVGETDETYYQKQNKQAKQQLLLTERNEDANTVPFEQVTARMTDVEREYLCEIGTNLLGQKVQIEYEQPGNSQSRPYYTIDSLKMLSNSSGSRMLLYLIAHLLNRKNKYLFIDEPELGLTPRIQNLLSELIQSEENKEKYFSHLEHIFITTHSHIFLAKEIGDNFIIDREKKIASVKKIETFLEFNQLKFKQLGNSLESLQLPTGFIIVEGVTDFDYLEKLLIIKYKSSRFNIIKAFGDGGALRKVDDLLKIIGDINKSPYKDRIIVIYDSKHTSVNKDRLIEKGILEENIIVWDNNGIEYYYPLEILRDIYESGKMEVKDLSFDGDKISFNGIVRTKRQLCDEVLSKLTGNEEFYQELNDKLFSKVSSLS